MATATNQENLVYYIPVILYYLSEFVLYFSFFYEYNFSFKISLNCLQYLYEFEFRRHSTM